jgi:hypothetical protein
MWLRKSYPQCKVMRFLLSPAATILAISILIGSCLWLGICGDTGFVESVPFVLVLLYVQTVVLLITLRGWKTPSGVIRWRFLLLHAGLLLALGSGFWGAPDSYEMRVALERGQETSSAFRMDGREDGLGYTLRLIDYSAEFSEDGKPVHYEASVSFDGDVPVVLRVNDPYAVSSGEDIYLASVSPQHCVLQIVREPWRYFALAGIVMMLCGAFLLFINGPKR